MKESTLVGINISHYHLVSQLGAGGMGEVYLAEDTQLDRKVAIKFLPQDSIADEQAKKRLVREARAAAKLDHHNICSIYEVGDEDGRSFIVMQYVEGETLADRIQRKPLELGESLDIAVQVSDGLAEAHSRGIIHRDIKPANIMITARGQAKVMDFGLAKVIGNQVTTGSEAETQSLLTDPARIMGTVPYMSPEQVRGEQLDARCDIFSFGATLYEMVSGRRPFAGESAAATISAILTSEPPPLARYASDVPEELQRIVRKCLEKDRERRYQTSRDLAVDLGSARRAYEKARLTASNDAAVTAHESVKSTDSDRRRYSFHVSRRASAATALVVVVATAVVLAYLFVFRGATVIRQPEIKSLAVLPLRLLSRDSNDDYLGLGIADTIITKVSQISELTVRPTSAVRKYADQQVDSMEAGRQLKVDSVLDGTVQRAGDRLRVSVNLLRTQDGISLWADSFDMRFTDIFAIQDRVSKEVATHLRLKLNAAEQARLAKRYTSNPEAYEYYLKGMYNFDKWSGASSKADTEAAIAMFKKAIEIDPKYALAHAQLAYSYTVMHLFFEPTPAWLERAKHEMSQAQMLDPDLAELHVVRSEILWGPSEGFQIEEAIRELRLAEELGSYAGSSTLGILYAHLGLDELALRELQRANEIDPASLRNQNRLAEAYIWLGRYDEAIDGYDRLIAIDPTNPGLYAFSSLACLYQNQLDEAGRRIERALALKPGDMIALSERALLLAMNGKFREAEAEIPAIVSTGRNLRSYHHATYNIASIYALEGKNQEAIEWLRTTIETGMPNYPMFDRDAHLSGIRKDPAFIQIMSDLKLRWIGYKREFE